MNGTPQRIIVVGAGAIGASVAALLFDAGVPCVLVVRGERAQTIRERGIDLRFPESARRVRVPVAATLVETAPTWADLVLVATMGQDTVAALGSLSPAVPVASFQNGLAPIEAIAGRGHPTLAAMLYVPAERRADNEIALPGTPVIGSILLGAWPSGANAWSTWLALRLAAAGFRAEGEIAIAPWIRAKLLVNLGGIVAALSDANVDDVVEAARAEARAVWRAAGEPFEDIPALMQRVGTVEAALVDGRARGGGSTRAALGRGEYLETSFLHGTIVAGGRAAQVSTPINAALIALAEQASREKWKPGCLAPDDLRTRVERLNVRG